MIDTGIIIDLEGVKKKRHADSTYGKSKSEIEKELFETHADCKRLASICKDACTALAEIRVKAFEPKPDPKAGGILLAVESLRNACRRLTGPYEDWVA